MHDAKRTHIQLITTVHRYTNTHTKHIAAALTQVTHHTQTHKHVIIAYPWHMTNFIIA